MTKTAIFRTLSLLIIILATALLFPISVKAAITSCTASVTPTEANPGDENIQFTISLNNTSPTDIVWFKTITPDSTITAGSVSMRYWNISSVGNTTVYDLHTLPAGDTIGPRITTNIPVDFALGFSGSWTVQVSDDPGGANPFTCTGSLGFTTTGEAADTTGPNISAISLSNITQTSAKVTWTTNEPATSLVKYDVSEDASNYPFSHSDATLKTSHSLTLTNNIATGTTYYYAVCSTDEFSNESCTSEGAFTTNSATTTTTTATVAPVVAPVVVATATPVPSPTPPPIDRTPPRVTIETKLDEAFVEPPLIKGKATDNKAVTVIEYSTDGGKNWLPVDETDSLGTSRATYEFTPFINEDGNYPIQVRAKDKRGNTGKSKEIVLVIDRLPPLVGGNLISMGPQALMPNADGTVIALAGVEQKITLSAVGGPTEIDLLVGDKKIPLRYSPETGLWSGFLNLDEVGVYTITAEAIDGAKNKTSRDLNQIQVIKSGRIIDGNTNSVIKKGKITIYSKDTQTQLWNIWDADAFGQENPQNIDSNGGYQFFLPPGVYYFKIESAGFSTLKSHIFTLDESRPVNSDFVLKDGRAIKFGPFKISLPSFLQKTIKVDLSLSEVESLGSNQSDLINQIAPSFSLDNDEDQFELSNIRGKTSIISFISTWSPPAIEQISIINQLIETNDSPITMISTQETSSKTKIFKQRGNYKSRIWTDPDGELIEKYQITTLPTHFVLDRRGKIINILTQVLNKEQLLALLSDTN